MKLVAKNSFYQLFTLYSIVVLLTTSGFLSKYTFQFNVLALVIALIGAYGIKVSNKKEERVKSKLHFVIIVFLLGLIVVLRLIPYIGNSVPLGYDPGIYKYGIEHGLQNLDNWILHGGLEPGFIYLMNFLHKFFSSDFLLIYGLIFFSVSLGLSVYMVTKEYFGNKAALFALVLFAFSAVQFKAFWYLYYKNIIGMFLMLLAFLFLKKSEYKNKWIWPFIITGGLLGSIHRPSFYIFGISYFIWSIVSPIGKKYNFSKLKINVLSGIGIIFITSLFYLGKFRSAWLSMFEPVLQGYLNPGTSQGTFINFFTFQFTILPYLVLALFGLFVLMKKKEFNILVIWTIINFAIVYFQFFFFNRFIIFLNLSFIIMAALGTKVLLQDKNKIIKGILFILLLSAGTLAVQESINSKPLISQDELDTIKYLQNTENDAFAMSTNSYYSPWVLGYSQRKTIAPGLFDYDNRRLEDWQTFWTTTNLTKIQNFMSGNQEPIYVYVGPRQEDTLWKFPQCFKIWYTNRESKIYRYTC